MKKYLKSKSKGFSLIELMVSVTIMSLMMMMAIPSFTEWMASLRVKTITDSINYGLIQTRAEAIRKNDLVTFTLNSDTSWVIQNADGDIINKKEAQEASRNTNVTSLPSNATKITFNGWGGVSPNFDSSSTLTSITITSSEIRDGIKHYVLRIGNGGAVATCSFNQGSTPC